MKLSKVLNLVTLIIAAILAVIFILDLVLGLPFGRYSLMTDIIVLVAAGLIIWQGWETHKQF
ncbi:hypothetical protein Pan216_56850 [Planctomycetes bacterium Pan216]|uniref:Uncharacterized protein n=1 Tax=Kolteria novifilia TaxID=2527975 RepID=A0A518BD19_9BACT|nr:hypothetical protein Pan216_56850 [Planctomycetes bacterium Pan216]